MGKERKNRKARVKKCTLTGKVRQRLRNRISDIHSAVPSVEVNQRLFAGVVVSQVILINPPAFVDELINEILDCAFVFDNSLYHEFLSVYAERIAR